MDLVFSHVESAKEGNELKIKVRLIVNNSHIEVEQRFEIQSFQGRNKEYCFYFPLEMEIKSHNSKIREEIQRFDRSKGYFSLLKLSQSWAR